MTQKERSRTTTDTIDALPTAVQALMQATQVLTATATQMMQTMQGMAVDTGVGKSPVGGGVLVAVSQINIWEDDPFSEDFPTATPVTAAPVAANVPTINAPLLQVAILDPQPAPGLYNPGTAEFRYWTAEAALARGINFWAPLLPSGTRWSTISPNLQVILVAGEDLNAFYNRIGLSFFQQTERNVTVFSGESPDVVCHELGHAILDALRPQLFDAASIEVAAFHEAFGDMSSMLSALQMPTVRQKILAETRGRLNVNSRLSRLAEQLGRAIRQLSPTAVDPDCLRNAVNRFFYQRPAQLPPLAPASQLSSQPHSFARVFTGAFLDALANMLKVVGVTNDSNLLTVSRDLGQLLVDGIQTAPITSAYFSQVAAAMIQADRVRHNGRYRTALSNAFIQRGILSPAGVAALANAPLPQLQAVPPSMPSANMVGMGGLGRSNGSANGAQTILTYGDGVDDSYQRGFEDAPELPTRTISTDIIDALLVHAPVETERFAVTSAALEGGSVEPFAPEDAARFFVEDLIQLHRVDFSSVQGIAPGLRAPIDGQTHEVVDTPEGRVLKRRFFDCGFHCRC